MATKRQQPGVGKGAAGAAQSVSRHHQMGPLPSYPQLRGPCVQHHRDSPTVCTSERGHHRVPRPKQGPTYKLSEHPPRQSWKCTCLWVRPASLALREPSVDTGRCRVWVLPSRWGPQVCKGGPLSPSRAPYTHDHIHSPGPPSCYFRAEGETEAQRREALTFSGGCGSSRSRTPAGPTRPPCPLGPAGGSSASGLSSHRPHSTGPPRLEAWGGGEHLPRVGLAPGRRVPGGQPPGGLNSGTRI